MFAVYKILSHVYNCRLFVAERHTENVRRHKQGTGKRDVREAAGEDTTGEDVWKRLEQLETKELARDELTG